MNKEERVKIAFKALSEIIGFEIKPNKDFYILANGKKTRHHINENLALMCWKSKEHYERSDSTILPIFKGGYKLEEIKELFTEDEKELLRKHNIVSVELLSSYIEDATLTPYSILKIEHKSEAGNKIEGLELNKKYRISELEEKDGL